MDLATGLFLMGMEVIMIHTTTLSMILILAILIETHGEDLTLVLAMRGDTEMVIMMGIGMDCIMDIMEMIITTRGGRGHTQAALE